MKDFIYEYDGVDEKTGLIILKKVDGETVFPTKEPAYSLWTKLRWKLERLHKSKGVSEK